MDEENKFTRNPDEGDGRQSGPTKPKDEGILKKVLRVTIELSRQALALAMKKFDEAGGIEGIRRKVVEFGTGVKAGFIPDADKAGFKRHASRFSNLWESGKAGKSTLIVGAVVVLLLVFVRGGRGEAEPADSSTVASTAESTVASADDIAQYVDGLSNQFEKEEEQLKQKAQDGQVADKHKITTDEIIKIEEGNENVPNRYKEINNVIWPIYKVDLEHDGKQEFITVMGKFQEQYNIEILKSDLTLLSAFNFENEETFYDIKFLDIDKDGGLEILIRYIAGSGGYISSYLLDNLRGEYSLFSLRNLDNNLNAEVLGDFNNDGIVEITGFTKFHSSTTGSNNDIIDVYSLFNWTGNVLIDVSDRFPDYYKKERLKLENEIKQDPYSDRSMNASEVVSEIKRYLDTGILDGIVRCEPYVLNVRESPSLEAEIFTQLDHGARVKITGIDVSGEWLEIADGWVMKKHIEVDENKVLAFGVQGKLCSAVKLGDLETVRELISNGADVNGTSKHFDSPNGKYYDLTLLQFAVLNNRYEVAKYLIDHGAEVNFIPENGDGLTSLHLACIVSDKYDNLQMVKLLVSSGADINATPVEEGPTPGAFALNKNQEVTDFLRSKGAEFAIQEEDLLASAIEEQPDSYENIGHIETQSTTQSFRKTGVTNVTAKTVGELWHSNRFAFDREYKGKEIILEGTVGRVSESDNTMSVDLLSTEMLLGTSLINCYLQTSESNKALKLQVQDDVKIQGRCMVEQGVFGDDELAIRDCVILEMPQQQVHKVVNEGTIPEVSLETLRQEMDDNEPRAMNKYEGKRVILKCTWDRVEKGDGDLPELKVMDFSSMCMASCLLRRGQEDYVATLDISSEIVINAIFNGGDCGWTGLKFRDGLVVK